jgi:hypothetical protein
MSVADVALPRAPFGTHGLFRARGGTGMVAAMGTPTPAEEMPALYRAILDRVAELEAAGERSEAARVRRLATDAYSRAWDDRARRRLLGLLRAAEAPTALQRRVGRSLRRPLSRRSARAPRPVVITEP